MSSMGRPRLSLYGQKFGKLTVIRDCGINRSRKSLWLCRCDCGNKHVTNGPGLRRGEVQSCGCLVVEKATRHGHNKTGKSSPTYRCWQYMLSRCFNPSVESYARYGGRGIKVCSRWRKFENFLTDMGEKPTGLELDRIDNDGDYKPGNCRWATHKEQCRNRRTNRFIRWRGNKKTLAEWSEITGIHPATLYSRLRNGWSVNKTLQNKVARIGEKTR